MAINDDVLVDINNKIVKREAAAGSTVYSVNALYSFIQDTFDELAGSEGNISLTMPMSAQTPTSYTMINGWYIQEELTKYLDGGAIQTNGYDDEIRTLICGSPGWVNFVAADVGDLITGSVTGDTGTLLDYDNAKYLLWVRMTGATDLFDNASENYTGAGTGTATATAVSTTGEHVFANPYTLGTLQGTPQLYIYQAGTKVTSWWSTGHFDILIKVTQSGVEIDSKQITVFGREWTDTGTAFEITLTTAGQNAVPLGTADDLNNQTAEATVEDWQDGTISNIAIDFAFSSPFQYDIGDGNGSQPYEVQINCDGQRLTRVYEVCKFWARDGSVKQLETDSDGGFINGEAYRYARNTYAEIVASPLGTFAGGKFFGARSVYFTNLHALDAQAFQLIDKNGITRNPPNYQSFSITGVVAGDRCAIYLDTAENAGIVNRTQYESDPALNVAGDNKFYVTTTLPGDTPASGVIIAVASGVREEHVYRYDSRTGYECVLPPAASGTADGGSTSSLVDSGASFLSEDLITGDIIYDSTNDEYAYVVTVDDDTTITTTVKTTTWDAANYATNSLVDTYVNVDTAYIPYIYKEATDTTVSESTTVYSTNRYVLCRVRKKGILPFQTTGTYSSTGYTAAAIRTPDGIVT